MLGLLLIYFIGKAYYQLAFDYNKSKWGFAILGIVTYYAGTFIGGIILGIIALFAQSNFVETTPSLVLNLMALPVGLLFCWGLYKILLYNWEKKVVKVDTLDGNLTGRQYTEN